MSRYKDFDADAKAAEPIEFKVKGHRYKLDGDPNIGPILDLFVEAEADEAKLETLLKEPANAMRLVRDLVGPDVWTELCKNGIGLKQFPEVIVWLVEQLGFGDTDGDSTADDDEAVEQGNGSRSSMSSSIGERSMLTSGVSIAPGRDLSRGDAS